MFDGVLVRELPYAGSDRLVLLGNTVPGQDWRDDASGLQRLGRVSFANFADWKQRARSYEAMVAAEPGSMAMRLNETGALEIVRTAQVTEGFFDFFSVSPILGRSFTKEEYSAHSTTAVILSYGAWVRRYGADPDVVTPSSSVSVSRMPIVGVLPATFRQPEVFGKEEVEFWMPIDPQRPGYNARQRRSAQVFARLRGGTRIDAVRAEISALHAALSTEFPAGNVLPDGGSLGAGLNSLHAETVGGSRGRLGMFLAASALLLFIAALNAGNLLFVRGLDREGEISLRQALGANRYQVVRGLLAESVLLSVLAGGLGIGLAYAGVQAFIRFGPANLPRIGDVAVDLRILVATAIVSLGTGLAVGLFPALRLTRRDVVTMLRRSADTTFAQAGSRVRQAMVAGQLALAVLLCIGACLLVNSYMRLKSLDPGFDADDLTVFMVGMKRPGARATEPWLDWDELRRRIEAVPGITSLTFSSAVPFQSVDWTPSILLPGEPAETMREAISGVVVMPDFFETLRIQLNAGRLFSEFDDSNGAKVAVVNAAFGREYFRGDDPVGRFVRLRDPNGETQVQIVGVVENIVQARPEDGWLPAVYVPYEQRAAGLVTVAFRSESAIDGVITDIRKAVAGFTQVPMLGLESMEDRIARNQMTPRFNALLIGTFAAVAILLAAVGIYGAMAHSVGRRTRELGIRIAVGADSASILRMVLGESLAVTAAGLGLGLGAAFGLTRFLKSFLLEVDALDPATLLTASAFLAAVVLLAVLRPAWRATRVDPLGSLKAE